MVAVLLNAAAGSAGGEDLPSEIARLFGDAGLDVEIIQFHPGENLSELARKTAATHEIVVAAGGDGTVNCVASAVLGTSAALGVLPVGTLNHFAKDLGLPTDLEGAVAVIAAGHVAQIDVGRVNGNVFINNSSIGLYPNIVLLREELRRHGRRKWIAFAIATLRVIRRYRGVYVRLKVEGRRSTRRTPFVFIGNNEYLIEGIHLGTRSRIDGGQLFVYLAPKLRARNLPMLFLRALFGHAVDSGGFEIATADEFWIDTPLKRKRRVAIDGEIIKMKTPLHYEILPGALKVLQPRPEPAD